MVEYQVSLEEFKEEEGGEKQVYLNEPLEEVEEGLDEGELLGIRRALSGLLHKMSSGKERPYCTQGALWVAKCVSLSLMGEVVQT